MDIYHALRPALFRLDPERAHDLGLGMARLAPWAAGLWSPPRDARLTCRVGAQVWTSPVGLAAGLDKNASAVDFFHRLGFGSMECGTVTSRPQVGNPKPRVHRYPAEASLRNSMGFPNQGAEACAARLRTRPAGFPVGVNIGKSKDATPAAAIDEYLALYERLAPLADWVVVNISSPNTPGLRDLQQETWLKDLFRALAPARARWGKEIHVKLSPDLDDQVLKDLTTTLADLGADGLVATNTTHIPDRGAGGVSGRLLRAKAHQKRRVVLEVARSRGLPLVGVGGFEDMRDVYAWWAAGGGAFQVYTALVFQGPSLVARFHQGVLGFLDRSGVDTLESFLSLPPSERQKLVAAHGSF